MKIKILVVDDHPIVRKGINACLSRQKQMHVVGEASNGCEAVSMAHKLQPDVVLMDIEMPQMNGLVATEVLRRELPNAKVLILSMCCNAEYLRRIVKSGAHGFVMKGAPIDESIRAIETVHSGELCFKANPDVLLEAFYQFVLEKNMPGTLQLAPREREVLICIAEGMKSKAIGVMLGISTRTVGAHREKIMKKLDIHEVAGLTRFAIRTGLIKADPDPNAS